jgi:hypothetical protein
LREQRHRKELEFQAALRALLIEMLRAAELALSGSGTVPSWGDPAAKTAQERNATAQAYEGKIPFTSAKYFRDRVWLKYEDAFIENLDSAVIYTVDTAYSGAHQVFDMVGSPLPSGSTLLSPQLPYNLWRVALDFSKAIQLILSELKDIQERERLRPRIEKLNLTLESQGKVVHA